MAGWTHEGITIPLSVGLLAAVFIFRSADHRSESLWMKVAFFAGAFVCMLFSLQQEQYLKNGSLADKFIFKWMIGMQVMQELYLVYLFVILFLILAVIRKIRVREFVCDNFPLLVAMTITLFIVFYSGIAENVRPAYSLEFCSLILILRMLSGFHLEKRPKRILISLLMVVLAAYTIPVGYYSYVNFQEHCDIERQIKKGEQLVVLDSREMPKWIEKNVCRTVNFYTGHPYYLDPDGDMCCYIAAYYVPAGVPPGAPQYPGQPRSGLHSGGRSDIQSAHGTPRAGCRKMPCRYRRYPTGTVGFHSAGRPPAWTAPGVR